MRHGHDGGQSPEQHHRRANRRGQDGAPLQPQSSMIRARYAGDTPRDAGGRRKSARANLYSLIVRTGVTLYLGSIHYPFAATARSVLLMGADPAT